MLSRMRFKGAWRDYQARILDEMEGHLVNGRLHVVAAPGAGKTVLGLEIVRRLGRPALVFAPTVAIRDQWAHRLAPLFLDEAPGVDDVSRKLAAPATLTLATYQALDALRRSGGVDDLLAALNDAGPVTLVLDEAHHLRREWWHGIERLAAGLADVRVLALTATPPYDATFAEWSRYESVCGPIDLEIGIPELVRNGDLCPHQDHVVLSRPTGEALELLEHRRRAIWRLREELLSDADLMDQLAAHPWLRRPQDHVEAILDTPEMLSAVLVILAAAGRRLPRAPLELLGVSARDVPKPTFVWLERFLDGVTGAHAGAFDLGRDRRNALRDQLHRDGLIEGRRVRLGHARSTFQLMNSSLAKLDSLGEIARVEDDALGDDLRMVVLSDHVRAADLPTRPDAEFRPAKLGVVPIFEHLRRAGPASGRLGVLTGSLVVLPRDALAGLRALLAERGLDPATARAFDLPGCPGYVRVELADPDKASLVHLVTALFGQGAVTILVGTQALLGEGWDAPALNSLVIASNTASFMLSNQMRGRAIRIQPGNPGKVANIWHLATVEPGGGPIAEAVERLDWGELMDEAPDIRSEEEILRRRFRAFEGVANGDSTLIESGFARLGLDFRLDHREANARAFAAAADRPAIARRWAESLGAGGARARVRETAAPTYAPRVLTWADTLQALSWSAVSAAAFAAGQELLSLDGAAELGTALAGIGGIAFLAGLPNLAKAARLMWRNGSVEGSLAQVGQVVVEALAHAGLLGPDEAAGAQVEVRASLDAHEVVVRGVSRSAERLVMQAIAEVLGPVENPRFLLVRTSRWGVRTRTDYHAVPAAFGARKAWAEHFEQRWNERVGSSRLVYTRTPEGRRVLLRARTKSLAAGLQRSVDRRCAWL